MKPIETKYDKIGTGEPANNEKVFAGEINSIASELENAVASGGQALDEANNYQLARSITDHALGARHSVDTGTVNNYILSQTGSRYAPTTLVDGYVLEFFTGNANTTTTPTLNYATLGVKTIVAQDGTTPIVAGDIKVGVLNTVKYDGTHWRLILPVVNIASETVQGISYAAKPILLTYSTTTVALYSSGTFNFSDGSGSAIVNSGSINLATVGLNGIDTGSIPTSGWLYTYAVYNPITKVSGCIASLSNVSPTLPSGFIKYKRIKNGFLRIALSAIQIFSHWERSWISTNQIVIANQINVLNFSVDVLPKVPLKADLVSYMLTGGAGSSSQVVWGDLKPWTSGVDALFCATNNGFPVAANGYIYASDGIVVATNPTISGGVINSQIILKAISEL